jgi:hypothetical protein
VIGKLPNRDMRSERLLHRPDKRPHQRADDRLKQRLLVAEVQIDRPFRDPGALCDIVEPRCGEAACGKFVERRGKNRLAPRGAFLLTLGRAGCFRF